MENTETVVILHNIRSTHNVGSIFRTADGVGVQKIYITGYTPTPKDRFGREVKEIHKTALGAEKSVQWENTDINSILTQLKKEGFYITAIEQDPKAVRLPNYKRKHKKVAFILGNEIRGVSKALKEKCDNIVEIPMMGKKESLNVSTAAGIVLFWDRFNC